MNVTPSVPKAGIQHIVIGLLSVCFGVFVICTVIIGNKSGELQSKVFSPLRTFFSEISDTIQKIGETDDNDGNSVIIHNEVNINSTSSSTIRIVNTTSTPERPIRTYTKPLYISPTPNPTIMQFNKEFDEKWDSMKKENEQSLKEFCAKMPSAPICH